MGSSASQSNGMPLAESFGVGHLQNGPRGALF